MRHSLSFFHTGFFSLGSWALSSLILSGCGAHAPERSSVDPYDSYYGQPGAQSRDVGYRGSLLVNPAAPRTYVVKKGDTLWGIARKFLNTPWYWPEIWDKNQRIPNPHLLYPGDILTLDYVGGGAGEKLMPRIRVERRGEGEPISSLIPFLTWPRVLDEATIDRAPYLLASRDAHNLVTQGETVYVKNLPRVPVGSRYMLFHPDKVLHDPETGELLGHEVTYVGYGRIERPGNPATASILEANREILPGDRLLAPADEAVGLRNILIQKPRAKVRGEVIALFDAHAISGSYMIAAINRGARHGIKPGYTLGVYAPGMTVRDPLEKTRKRMDQHDSGVIQLPPEKAADLVIYKVTDKVSYGLILDSTREVENGYKIGNP